MSKLEEALKDINKKHKEDIAFKGLERTEFERIPFTSIRANYCLYGGIPRNMITEFCGEEGSGKTTSALDICNNAQKIFKKENKNQKVVYIDAENTLDEKWAEKLGVDIDDLILIRPQQQTTEQILDIAKTLIETGECGLMVIDSVATLVPQQIYEESFEKKSYGGNAVAFTRFVNLIGPLLHKYKTTLLLINQVRQDINNPYNQYITTGGQGLKHACSVRLMFRKDGYINEEGKQVANSFENPSGHLVRMAVLKTKVCRHDRKLGYYTLRYVDGIDWVSDLIDCGIKFGLINQSGAWFYLFNEEGEQIGKYQGVSKLIAELKANNELSEQLLYNLEKHIKTA